MTGSPQLRPLGETLGTEALGIDLSKPLDEATSAWVRRAFAEHPVLVFRDQDLGAQAGGPVEGHHPCRGPGPPGLDGRHQAGGSRPDHRHVEGVHPRDL